MYIDGECFSIAILSQNSDKTKVDYRDYDYQRPNRKEYYQLPFTVESLIRKFMKRLNLQTGSLDFILTPLGEHIFLEINPCGQYDIFNFCNVNPDKLIAQHLINKAYEH